MIDQETYNARVAAVKLKGKKRKIAARYINGVSDVDGVDYGNWTLHKIERNLYSVNDVVSGMIAFSGPRAECLRLVKALTLHGIKMPHNSSRLWELSRQETDELKDAVRKVDVIIKFLAGIGPVPNLNEEEKLR
jgi:hypothetical protein